MKKKKVKKIILLIILIIVILALLFVLGTYIYHRVKTNEEISKLKEEGYYNPISVGDYSLNVAKFGNESGKHTIVGLAGLGMGDYSVSARQMTKTLEEDNLVVFVDRAGYGFSDDTNNDMTLEYIVEDYRKALKNAGIKAPYILMPHSIGGAYATYWVSKYPQEIEAIAFVDGSQLSADAFDDEEPEKVDFEDKFLATLAKMGFSRYVLRDYFYHYPKNYSDEEQYLGDALYYMTMDSIAPISETAFLKQNAKDAFNGAIKTDVPKIYICASWGRQTKEDIIENFEWINEQIESYHIKMDKKSTDLDDKTVKEILEQYEEMRENDLKPYLEKMGNCELIYLSGDHMIYEQKPDECGKIIKEFIDNLD
jgi:pimeloyl-ACP methyl ester carboxylesterase